MNTRAPFLTVNRDCHDAIEWFSDRLRQAGLQVLQTFDFQAAQADHGRCSCLHHGTERCDCQMIVLFVYEAGYPPASIFVHGRDGITWFLLAGSNQNKFDAQYEARIQDTLAPYTEILMPEQWNRAA